MDKRRGQYGDLSDWIPTSVSSAISSAVSSYAPASVSSLVGVQQTLQAPGVPRSTAQANYVVASVLVNAAASLPTLADRSAVLEKAASFRQKGASQDGSYAGFRALGDTIAFWLAGWWSGLSTDPADIQNVLKEGAQYAFSMRLANAGTSLAIYASRVAIDASRSLYAGKSPIEQQLDRVVSTVSFGVFRSFRRVAIFAGVLWLVYVGTLGLGIYKFRKPIKRTIGKAADTAVQAGESAVKAAVVL